MALHELLVASDELKEAVVHRKPVGMLRDIAVADGMQTLAQDGVSKALAGLTDLKQVMAVCTR